VNLHSLLEQAILAVFVASNDLQSGHFSPVGACQRANLQSGYLLQA